MVNRFGRFYVAALLTLPTFFALEAFGADRSAPAIARWNSVRMIAGVW